MAGVRKHNLNLPGVDTSQPDVFETPDLPAEETSQEVVTPKGSEAENESIDRSNVAPKKAFDKFAEKSFATGDKDYSENVGKKKGGLLSGQREFSIKGEEKEAEVETPLQKFHRLQFEVAQFIKETKALEQEQAQGNKPALSFVDGVNAGEIAQQLVVLQTQLTSLLSSDPARAAIDPAHYIHHHALLQSDLSKKLISEIQAVSSEGGKEKEGAGAKEGGDGGKKGVTYELYYTPDQQKYVHLNKLVDLEKRVAQLEELVGTPSVPGTSSAPATSAPLASLVGDLRDKVTLLDGPRLESLIQKIKALTPQLEAAAKNSTQERAAAQDKKINEMYEMMSKWDSVSTQLPALVSRMVGLRAVHEDAARFASAVSALDREQGATHALLKDNAELIATLDASFKANMTTIQNNVKLLDSRFTAIQQKMGGSS
eukprot:Phypoly_transcript_08877.p1 GENE.Phypoly_transcript_08877~~Phypoly_transcript_08877.p1  ORF type:complete len:458 (+),score=137.11 Phypoly_transcript_08877:92-1375(+)